MSLELIILIVGLVFISITLIVLLRRLSSVANHKPDDTLLEWLKSMQTSVDRSSVSVTTTLQKNTEELNRRLDTTTRLMGDIQREAGRFSELSLSMKNLQDYLKSPKLRGNIGEQVLKDLISQMFPKNSFFLQYTFKSGEKVDAAIKTDAGILPIDSKFPAENFQKLFAAENDTAKETARKDFVRDVKKHISDIAKKYILPEEGTMDFALMYVPSEPVYYEVVNDQELTEYARQNRVYPVSPNTLYANLQVILLSFEGKDIERRSHELFALLRGIQKDYSKLADNISILNRHITNSFNQMSNVNSEFTSLGQKLASTSMLEVANDTPKLTESASQ